MIIFRYLAREVLTTLSAVTAILLVIIMSGRFIKYLAQAVKGAIEPGVLLSIMAYRLPGFLQLILPLGLFLGILLAYGRLYLDSEITVLSAAGVSSRRLLAYSLIPAILVALVVAYLSLWGAPQGIAHVERILNEQDSLTEFDTLVPGRFQAMQDGSRVTYTQELSSDKTQLKNIFITEKKAAKKGKKPPQITVLVAKNGHQKVLDDGSRYLVLNKGYRYDGNPGQADYRVLKYDTYGVLLPKPAVDPGVGERDSIPTSQLLKSKDIRDKAELQWRISIPLLTFIVTLIAVPLSRVNPRQGRFLKLLPAVFLYMTYLALLISALGSLHKGKIPSWLGLWWVHAIFLLVGLILNYWETIQLKIASYKAQERSLA